MTKLHGLETLFYGTAVVYAPCGPVQSLRGFKLINWGGSLYLVDIINVTLYLFLFDQWLCQHRTWSWLLHRCAADQAAPEAGTTSAFFCI